MKHKRLIALIIKVLIIMKIKHTFEHFIFMLVIKRLYSIKCLGIGQKISNKDLFIIYMRSGSILIVSADRAAGAG